MSNRTSTIRGNLFATAGLVHRPECEDFATLLQTDTFKLERIVSFGQTTPEGEWYDQAWDEWVVLLSGAARLRLEGEGQPCELRPGDWLLIPAHLRHRVEWTDPARETVWLALHLKAGEALPDAIRQLPVP